MDDYIEYQIITGEDNIDDKKDNNAGGCIILILIIIIALWITGKLFG
ncbi:MAG: hypothetical protein IJ491_02175 [Clostridia bacterium]|nr:hypothetical protein [Clostridia bacterium]